MPAIGAAGFPYSFAPGLGLTMGQLKAQLTTIAAKRRGHRHVEEVKENDTKYKQDNLVFYEEKLAIILFATVASVVCGVLLLLLIFLFLNVSPPAI